MFDLQCAVNDVIGYQTSTNIPKMADKGLSLFGSKRFNSFLLIDMFQGLQYPTEFFIYIGREPFPSVRDCRLN